LDANHSAGRRIDRKHSRSGQHSDRLRDAQCAFSPWLFKCSADNIEQLANEALAQAEEMDLHSGAPQQAAHQQPKKE